MMDEADREETGGAQKQKQKKGREETGDPPNSPFSHSHGPPSHRRRRGVSAAAAMAVMGRLRIFVVQEPVVAASCLIAGFGTLSSPPRLPFESFGLYSVVYAYVLGPDHPVPGCRLRLYFSTIQFYFLLAFRYMSFGCFLLSMRLRNAGFIVA
jgi:hypothetical protein